MPARHVPPSSDSLLLELHRAHDAIVQAMEGLIRLTGSSRPEERPLRQARLNLDRASIQRQLLWAEILHFLMPRVGRFEQVALQHLQDIHIQLIRACADHARSWTAAAIFDDWLGYCEASGAMRRRMIAAMAAERRILYPLLRGIGANPGPSGAADQSKDGAPATPLRLAG